jgi:hypothetical protein
VAVAIVPCVILFRTERNARRAAAAKASSERSSGAGQLAEALA